MFALCNSAASRRQLHSTYPPPATRDNVFPHSAVTAHASSPSDAQASMVPQPTWCSYCSTGLLHKELSCFVPSTDRHPDTMSRNGQGTRTTWPVHSLDASGVGQWDNMAQHPAASIGASFTPTTAVSSAFVDVAGCVVCPTIESIPPGRQAGNILRCGYVGCTSKQVFERKYELQRHMETHEPGKFPCPELGCCRSGRRAFTRREHLRNHISKLHSTRAT